MTDVTTRLRAMADIVDADVGADTDALIQTLRDGADATASLLGALEYARRFLKPADHDAAFVDAAIASARGER